MRFFAGAARILEGKAAGEYMEGFTSYVRREPIGVVGQVTPWNYPFMMALWKIGPALAAGNTIVLKPSDTTPGSTLVLAKLSKGILPDGVFNVVLGNGGTGATLVENPALGLVSIRESMEKVQAALCEGVEITARPLLARLDEGSLDVLTAEEKPPEKLPRGGVAQFQVVSPVEPAKQLVRPGEVFPPRLGPVADRPAHAVVVVERFGDVEHGFEIIEAANVEIHVFPALHPLGPARGHPAAVEHDARVRVDLAGEDVLQPYRARGEPAVQALQLRPGGLIDEPGAGVGRPMQACQGCEDLQGTRREQVVGIERGDDPSAGGGQGRVARVGGPGTHPAGGHAPDPRIGDATLAEQLRVVGSVVRSDDDLQGRARLPERAPYRAVDERLGPVCGDDDGDAAIHGALRLVGGG